jgi:coenzyme F420-0:L-glutamate ligase / coenzyme F420-1:gamma-L-glutamate ligase
MKELRVIPLSGVPEVREGDDLAELFCAAAGSAGLRDDDVLVVAQKVVSKSEGRIVDFDDKDAIVRSESNRLLRRTPGGMWISETHHGFVCANAGVDASNVEGDRVALLPADPDLSARRIRARVKHIADVDVAVIVSDTFGRAWRLGQTNVAIGIAGMDPFLDHRGATDAFGMELSATNICIADEIAGAAEIVMGKTSGICCVVVRGAPIRRAPGEASSIARSPHDDLFR